MGDGRAPSELIAHGIAERRRGASFTVDHIDGIGLVRRSAQPADEFALIGVNGKAAEIDDLRLHGYVTAEKFGLSPTVDQRAPPGSRRLKADEDDRIASVGEALREVMQDAPSRGHARGGDDHRGPSNIADGLGGFDRSSLRELVRPENVWIRSEFSSDLVVSLSNRISVDLERGECHRAVDVNRERRDHTGFDESLEVEEDDLCAIHCKRRNYGDARSIDHLLDGFPESLFGVALAVFLVAVGRLDHDVMRISGWGRWAEEGV